MKDWNRFLVILAALTFGLWVYGVLKYGEQMEFTTLEILIMTQ